jgi:outer membrane usher protein
MTRSRASRTRAPVPRYAALAFACAAALAGSAWTARAHAAAAAAAAGGFAEFDRGMLAGGDSNAAELARFAHGNLVLPGIYNVDVSVNQNWIGRLDVRFAAPTPGASAVPCVDQRLLDRM